MSYTDKNKIFFGLLHYILSEQSNVNWALKTSLVNFTGINGTLNQRRYKNDSVSNNILKYIKDVKPYHVQFDNYIEKYSTKEDVCKIKPNDILYPTIKVRFDAVSTKPDIKDIIYTYTESGEPKNIKSSENETKYLDISLKTIFILKYDRHNKPYWEFFSNVEEGDILYVEKDETIKKFNYIINTQNIGYYDLQELTYKELVDFENTTAANRLFLYKTHDFNLIKDYLNAHFKGLTLDGGDFNIDRFGYDAFLYDFKRYEEPIKTSAYCFIQGNIIGKVQQDGDDSIVVDVYDNIISHSIIDGLVYDDNENIIGTVNEDDYVISYNTKYSQINVGDVSFKIDTEEIIMKPYLTIELKKASGDIVTIEDYSLDLHNRVTLFEPIHLGEEITVTYDPNINLEESEENDDENNGKKIFKYFSNTFEESNDDSYLRKFFDINVFNDNKEYVFSVPESSIKANKIIVEIEKPNGYRKVTTNYTIKDDIIYLPCNFTQEDKTNWKVYISIADYSSIYDKIYTWEDVYGISNNKFAWENYYRNAGLIQNNYGGDFLNPHYEENRPSELTVIYPQNTLFVYTSKANESKKNNFVAKRIFDFDFKNKQEIHTFPKTAKLIGDFNIGDTEIHATANVFQKPFYYEWDKDKLQPGKICINSEIIEYFEYIINEDNTVTFKRIRRGVNGTHIPQIHKENSVVYPYHVFTSENYDVTPSYYYIKTNDIKKLTINGEIENNDLIKVYRTTNIQLLSKIDSSVSSFNISDNSINLPEYDKITNNLIKRGYLFINGDKILFDNIYKYNNYYTISGFSLPLNKTYDIGSKITSIKYNELEPYEYSIKSEKYDELNHLDSSRMRYYITFNRPLNAGECVIIENHNKNVFQ